MVIIITNSSIYEEGIEKSCGLGLKDSLNKGYGKSGRNVKAKVSGRFVYF